MSVPFLFMCHTVIQRKQAGRFHLACFFKFCFQDLEEQSRLIAASSRSSNQPGPDGQFLVLSSSQSEDSDAAEEGKKKGESEA